MLATKQHGYNPSHAFMLWKNKICTISKSKYLGSQSQSAHDITVHLGGDGRLCGAPAKFELDKNLHSGGYWHELY
ncbi:MAG: hypothetical protein P8X63_06945, partial [Desulfuromonadaceae bacterium]